MAKQRKTKTGPGTETGAKRAQGVIGLWRADRHLRIGVLAALGGAVAGFALALAVRAPAVPETTPAPVSAAAAPVSAPAPAAVAAPLLIETPAPTPEPAPASALKEQQTAVLTPAPIPAAKAPYSPPVITEGAPLIAIVIDDVGLNRARTQAIIAIDAPLTLSFLTYAENLPDQTRAARARGHEVMAHISMEPMSRDADPGPDALLTSHSEAEILRRLRRGLGGFEGMAGVNNHMGSRFTADSGSLMTVMAELRARGLYFLDSRTSGRSVAGNVAFEFGVPFAVRDVFLDDAADTKTAAQRLAETEALARRRGYAVAIGHPRDATLAALRTWIPEARARGAVIAPVSAIIRRLEAGG